MMVKDERLYWLDWMKVWATLAVVWGHFFACGDVFVYVFHVQVFCVISGFLHKKAPDFKSCLRRCFWSLLLPTLILSFIVHFEGWLRYLANGMESPLQWSWFFRHIVMGYDWTMGPCWYFYTLMVIRLIMQLLPEKKWSYVALLALFSVVTILLNIKGIQANNAIVNVLSCMPFFLFGVFLKPLRLALAGLHKPIVEALLLILSMAVVAICGIYNGYVWMYLNSYGNNYLLYLIGGMSGTVMLYILSLWLCRFTCPSAVITLSKGTMLVIGLHIIIVRRLTDLPNRLWLEDLVAALLIMLCFIPLVRLAEKYFPLLLGRCKL